MTLNDESLLTAYLDGELEPDERASIESALVADPVLAKQLWRLTELRDLIVGLPRPVLPVDLAGAISARIGPSRVALGFWPALRPRSRVVAAALWGFALAASLLIAVGLALRSRGPASPPTRGLPPVEIVEIPTRSVEPKPANVAESTPPRPGLTPRPAAVVRKRDDVAAGEEFRAMLDSPRLRRVFLVTDIIGEGTPDRVGELVQKTPRTDASYGRIIVSQGIVIDPLHPNEATVFALVMNEQELGHLRRRLEQSFPQRVEEAEADPIVVAQLAEVGQVAVMRGTPASSVVIPGDVSPQIALRENPSLQRPVQTSQLTPPFGRPDLDAAAGLGTPPSTRGTRTPSDANASAPAAIVKDEVRATRSIGEARPGSTSGAQAAVEGVPMEGKLPEAPGVPGSLAESLRTINLHEPPEIVLVWVTSS